jgi:hypothetical protein
MKKVLLVGLFLALVVGAEEVGNWTGGNDTAKIAMTGTGTYWTKSFNLSKYMIGIYPVLRVDLAVNDTDNAGFNSDSIGVQLAYQTWHMGKSSSGGWDTVAAAPIIVDTLDAASTYTAGTINALGVPTRVNKLSDTTMLSGYTVLTRQIIPEADQFIRFRVVGLASNDKSTLAVIGWLGLGKPLYANVKERQIW